jgi:hypothetical protein
MILTGLVFLLFLPSIKAQDVELDYYDSLLNDYLTFDSLLLAELEYDSSGIMAILAEIIDENYLKSQLIVRTGYTSDIVNAGRDYGIQQYGLNAGIAFYHKSGLFADVSGYYNSDIDPNYNTTITSAGYMGSIMPNWLFFVSYNHYIYHEAKNPDLLITYPLTNAFNGSTSFYLKKLNFGLDYSYLFGDEDAHRARANISLTLDKRKWGFLDRIAFTPNISMLLGNANVTSIVFNEETAKRKANRLIDRIGRARFLYLYNNYRDELIDLLSETQTVNAFGVMNYSIFMPLTFTVDKTTLLLNYTLNFPVALPGEENIDTSPNSYFSASLLFAFQL